MGHFVTGIIGKSDILAIFARQKSLSAPVSLFAGLALLPLRDEELDSFLPLPLTGLRKGFNYLSDQLLGILTDLSSHDIVMYFETEYFGGIGAQGAVVMLHGRPIYGPRSAELGPINEALTLLGVEVQPPACDEFDTVGLGRYRSTEDWLAADKNDVD
jgi:hypothetical protein